MTSLSSGLSLATNKHLFLRELLHQVTASSQETDWLQELRQTAADSVNHSSVPTTKDEEWRFTDLSPLYQQQFFIDTQLTSPDISSLRLSEAINTRLVFVNGFYVPELSTVADLPSGVMVSNLAGLSTSWQESVKPYLAQSQGGDEFFTALNTAGITDGVVIWLGRNVVVETPIHLLFISQVGEIPTISQPRCLVVAETGSSVNLVEDYFSLSVSVSEEAGFTNAVTEVWIGENAQVHHTRIARNGAAEFHLGKTSVCQARDSRYTGNALTFGGKLSRHNLEVFSTGEQTETILNGLTVITGKQLADTHSLIALSYPHCMSRQLHKSIVADSAHAVFNGKVFVPKAAQLTDAGQLNRNLLLSPKARVDTKPQLEITADNVKCAHGATVSQLEDDEIFYLQSRGINEEDARSLLINAFAAEVINQVSINSLQDILLSTVREVTLPPH